MVNRIPRSAPLWCFARRTPIPLLLAAAAIQTACGDTDAETARTSPTVPTRAVAYVPQGDPLRDYELTVENLRNLYHAHHRLYALSQRDPAPLEKLEEDIREIPPEEFEKIVATMNAVPAFREELDKARITPRDFYLTQYNLVNAVTVLQARTVGRSDNLPDASERNIEFVRQNPNDVERAMTERRPKSP